MDRWFGCNCDGGVYGIFVVVTNVLVVGALFPNFKEINLIQGVIEYNESELDSRVIKVSAKYLTPLLPL